jgi:RNA polymerase sigma factor (sigma-70 family)
MTNGRSGQLTRRLRGLVADRDDGAGSDGELLERYIRDRDGAAFTALVRRHGPMVWGVCRRLLGDHHDAEDAFQATFLVLVGRAEAVSPRDRVANWLYGVAYRAALSARTRAVRRHRHERAASVRPETFTPETAVWSDLRPVLDRELSRLPAKYREAILLCDVGDHTYPEAARRLGCSEGTLAARLHRARALLASRLCRRGVTLPAVGLTAALSAGAAAGAPPPRLVARTVDLAELMAAGAPAGAVPAGVAALANGGLRAMSISQWKIALAGAVFLAAVLVGVEAAEPAPPIPAGDGTPNVVRTARRAAPVPKRVITPISATNAAEVRSITEHDKRAYKITRGPGKNELTILDWDNGVEVVDDVTFRAIRTYAKDKKPIDFAMSPGGKFQTWTERGKKTYTVFEAATGKSFDIEIGDFPGSAVFSPDGKFVAIGNTVWDLTVPRGAGSSEMRLYDVTGKLIRTFEKTGPGGLTPVFSPDGKTLAVGNRNHETILFEVATGKLLHTLEKKMTQEIAFSPDGKTLAAGYVEGEVGLWDVATGKKLRSAATGGAEVYSVDWSPKGDVLVTAGREGKIVLWEPQQLTKLKELDAPIWVIQVRFTADGTRLLSSSSSDLMAKGDRKVTVWGLASGADK